MLGQIGAEATRISSPARITGMPSTTSRRVRLWPLADTSTRTSQ